MIGNKFKPKGNNKEPERNKNKTKRNKIKSTKTNAINVSREQNYDSNIPRKFVEIMLILSHLWKVVTLILPKKGTKIRLKEHVVKMFPRNKITTRKYSKYKIDKCCIYRL
ncbi:hypothetical protein [Pseudobutyrivibrio ruminis]|uniref:hypothetical protein n=1 Tax=Pseudobutyrivibrio ruminis TaxID=46206 RepID=UPI00051BF108|nr:hypothetical protein [Pseudobutyrivibrio ruminis]